jgi:uncharacterized protein (DUF1501 family)
MTTWTRRRLLQAGIAASALGVGLRGRAAGESNRRFLFILANGGWDTTRVLTPMLSSPLITPEPGATAVQQGGLTWVDHPNRPSVRRFFQAAGDRVAVVQGMLIPSVNHRACARIVQTGSGTVGRPDWASILGGEAAGSYAMPTVVLEGPSNPGPFEATTQVIGAPAQLGELLDGSGAQRGDLALPDLPTQARSRIDALVADNAAHHLASATVPAWQAAYAAHIDALDRAAETARAAGSVDFAGEGFEGQIDAAVDLLAAGVSRCAELALGNFDSHADNADQGPLYEGLFSGLLHLLGRLQSTAGPGGAPLADDTVVVVYSEMGRTPYVNDSGGTDHWPYTAAMLFGPGVRGGVSVGGYDDFLLGQPVDLASGAVTPGGTALTAGHLGATVLALGGVDPAAWVAESPIAAVLDG